MFFVSNTSNCSEFFSSQDYKCETLKNDISLSESSSLSSKTDCRDLNLEHFCGSPIQEVPNEDLVADLANQTLSELEGKTNCLAEETNNDLFPQPLEDQEPSEHHTPEDLQVVSDSLRTEYSSNKLNDQSLEEKLEDVGPYTDNITVGAHHLLQNNIIVLQCAGSDANDSSLVSPLISLNKPITEVNGTNDVDLGFDKGMTLVSVDEDPMYMRILCLESEMPNCDTCVENPGVRNGDSKVADATENSEQVTVSGGIMLKHTDAGILSVIPINSVVLGNITLLPQSKPPLKLQVIRQDGVSKSLNVVKPLIVTDVTWDSIPKTEKKCDSEYLEDSKPVTEVISPDAEKPYKCELCNTTFNRLGNFTRHKKIHTAPTKEDPRFQCEVCDKKFIQRCDLTRHMHVHSGTEPHRCAACGKGYLRHSDLLTHQRFHNREKPFVCPQCTKGFSQKGDLNRHLRSIHLHIKPLTCAHCHKKFAKEATLIRHFQVAHRNLSLDLDTACS